MDEEVLAGWLAGVGFRVLAYQVAPALFEPDIFGAFSKSQIRCGLRAVALLLLFFRRRQHFRESA